MTTSTGEEPEPSAWTVVICLVLLSNGSSATRGSDCRSCRHPIPSASAAASSASSVGSPSPSRPVDEAGGPPAVGSPGSDSWASLQRTAARSSRLRPRSPRTFSLPRSRSRSPSLRSPPTGQTSVHRIRPCVSVPVLSVARTETEPSVSTAARRRTMAFRRAIRRAPSARLTATTAGSDSGTAATARLSAVTTMRSTGSPRARPRRSTTAQRPTAIPASCRPRTTSRRCKGVCCAVVKVSEAIRPKALDEPVAVTVMTARPLTTTVPAEMTSLETPGVPASRSTANDSPVMLDSSTSRDNASTTVPSAGTMSPSPRMTTSPGTRLTEGTASSTPARRTRTSGVLSSRRAVISRADLISWLTPTVVLTRMTRAITAVSAMSPVSDVSTLAAKSSRIIGSFS